MLARQSTPTVYPVGKVSNPYRCLFKKIYFFFYSKEGDVFHLRGMFTQEGSPDLGLSAHLQTEPRQSLQPLPELSRWQHSDLHCLSAGKKQQRIKSSIVL